MQQHDPKIILKNLKSTLYRNHVDFEGIIDSLGQVEAVKKRENKQHFTFKDHLKGLILSLLSNQRPWKPIMENLDKIDEIFFHYDPSKLEKVDPNVLVEQITAIKCGNRKIKIQMETLSDNIQQLKYMEEKCGSLDEFVTHKSLEEVQKSISDPNSEYKLKQVGPALAMEYLKNVGISSMKPDTHLIRICGPDRLNIIPLEDTEEQIKVFQEFVDKAGVSATYFDNLVWIFGADSFGEICTKEPKCAVCDLGEYCNKNSF